MRRVNSVFAVLAIGALCATSTEAADSAVRCVQTELNRLDLNAGPSDGLMGRRTLGAAAAYLERPDAVAGLPPLAKDNARQWCEALAKTHPETAPMVFVGDWAAIEYGPGVSAEYRNHIVEAVTLSSEFFAEELDLQSQSVTIFASSDLKWLADRNIEVTGTQWSARSQSSIAERYETVTAEAGMGWMVINTGLDNYSMYPGEGGVRAQRVQLVAHELFHTQQNALTGDRAAGYVFDPIGTTTMGPNWLIEGAAEYVGYSLVEEMGFITIQQRYAPDFQRALDWEDNGALPLSEYETKQQADRPFFWDVSRVGVQALVAEAGIDSLPVFWREMGKGEHWEDAFTTAFGVDVGTFYDGFNAKLGRDPVERRVWR